MVLAGSLISLLIEAPRLATGIFQWYHDYPKRILHESTADDPGDLFDTGTLSMDEFPSEALDPIAGLSDSKSK